MRKLLLAVGLLAGSLALAADAPAKATAAAEPADTSAAEAFYFHDGDRIVAVGDSITLGGHYMRFIENYLRTRFPRWKIMVRTAGVNGCSAQNGLLYMDEDVLPWKPTVAVLHYGLLDGHIKEPVAYWRAGIVPYAEKLLRNGARVALLSRTPVDNGDPPDAFASDNAIFDELAKWTEGYAREKGLGFVDQFHFLHTLYALNRQREVPVSVTRATLFYENKKRPKPVPVNIKNKQFGDSLHPAIAGHVAMAYVILKGLHAPAEVSSATIDVTTGESATRNCAISNFKVLDRRDMETFIGGTVKDAVRAVSFERKDEASPWWIEDLGASALELVPIQEELNRMPLQVKGLFPGTYQLKIDGFVQGFFTDQQLADGINLSLNRASPLYDPGRKVEQLVQAQHGAVIALRDKCWALEDGGPMTWRPNNLTPARRAAAEPKRIELEKRDLEIARAGQPVAHTYEITVADFEK